MLVLVVRRPDATTHVVPLSNKATLMAHNKRLPAGQKFTLEEMEEEDAKKLPYIDPNYVSPADAQKKLKNLQEQNESKDAELAELRARLAQLEANGNSVGGSGTGEGAGVGEGNENADAGSEKAVDVIAKINAASTADEVNAILGTDTRKTVIDAANKKIASFSNE